LVGSATISVPRSADSTRFCAVGATLEHAASGATGDSSIASKAASPRPIDDPARCHARVVQRDIRAWRDQPPALAGERQDARL